jgi:hypothetical protein
MKRYFVGLTFVVAALLLCGPASAEYTCVQNFDDLIADEELVGQDNWVIEPADGANHYTDVKAEADANKHGYASHWTGFSGNVADCGVDSQLTRPNGGDWDLAIPSNSTEVTLSYTLFSKGTQGNVAGFRMGDDNLFYFGVKYRDDEWRSWTSIESTFATGTGARVLTEAWKSYAVTVVVDLTNPSAGVYADMLVENLTDAPGEVEAVLDDIDLGLTGDALNPANWDGFYVRLNQGVMDNLTVTASGTAAPPIPGDANNSGTVDDADASILAAHWQQAGNWGDGDFNGDNIVNDQDASILAAHWLESRESTSPVPEPSTLIGLLALGLAGLVALRRR